MKIVEIPIAVAGGSISTGISSSTDVSQIFAGLPLFTKHEPMAGSSNFLNTRPTVYFARSTQYNSM
jgi:hypothetical protein